MNRIYRLILPLLGIWLIGWLVLSWAAIQDDALIHLRYAENLFRTHQITYDGVHPNYGASSLLYVHLLAFLRPFTQSPNLPRAVSTGAHLLLVIGTAVLLLRLVPARATLARLLGLVVLYLLVSPSAVRWLDDGMETGLGLCFVAALCAIVFVQSTSRLTTAFSYLGIAALVFFMVLLRIEFAVLCGVAFVILIVGDILPQPLLHSAAKWIGSALRFSYLLLGCSLAYLLVFVRMHALLPDTALAKSDSTWKGVLYSTASVLTSALSFGIGLMLFWLFTFALAYRSGRRTAQLALANSIFPITLLLAAVRGQEIQGARYLAWTFFFSILWNIFELGQNEFEPLPRRSALYLTGAWIALLLIVLPFESRAMSRVLRGRAQDLKVFERNNLQVLENMSGIASDVGYIGYFSHANLCDLAGLINGRAAARLTGEQRTVACVASNPGFMFLSAGQFHSLASHLRVADWTVCNQYDFTNLRNSDTHYLLLPTATAVQLCRQISPSATPYPAANILHQSASIASAGSRERVK